MADPSSLSNPHEVKVNSMHLELHVDFDRKVLTGFVQLQAEVVSASAALLVLDTRHLLINSVVADGETLQHELVGEEGVFGRALSISIPATRSAMGSQLSVRVHYETTASTTALQWLEPAQTAGKVHPYLFSQCQAIHARSMVPCQDTPSNKVPYTAAISVRKPLTVLMSAISTTATSSNPDTTTYHFEQKIPIPTYLIAIVAAELTSRDVGPRSKIWSEPSTVDAGAYEFANTESFIHAGEQLCGPYVWGKYDVLLLPPSFPYGGMENPTLTFVTPTLLAADRSLENVVAHEIAHSWSGNFVTNRYWSEFFLNEGFTVFIERKIIARLKGAEMFDFEGQLGIKHLADDIDHFGHSNPLTALRPNLQGIDPDDAFSSVPYEKGFSLLCYLQSIVGVPRFEAWLVAYFKHFAYQSITADQMQQHLIEFVAAEDAAAADALRNQVDWRGWYESPGMPLVAPKFSDELAAAAKALAQKVLHHPDTVVPQDIAAFQPNQVLMLLDQLLVLTEPKGLPHPVLLKLEAAFNFSASRNSERRFRWYMLCLKSGYEAITPNVTAFLKEQGRMKFIRPLYRELAKTSASTKQAAIATFTEMRDQYHAIASRLVAKDLEV